MMVLRPALRPIPTLCSSIAPPAGSSLNGGVKRCLPLRIAAFSNTPEWYEKKRARALSGTGILVGDLVGTGKGIKVGDLLGSGTATKSNSFKEEEVITAGFLLLPVHIIYLNIFLSFKISFA